MLILNTCPVVVPPAPTTLNVVESEVVELLFWTYSTEPAFICACVNEVIVVPGADVNAKWPFVGALVIL